MEDRSGVAQISHLSNALIVIFFWIFFRTKNARKHPIGFIQSRDRQFGLKPIFLPTNQMVQNAEVRNHTFSA